MNRLTTDNPESNYELGLNLAYVKDDEVWLRLDPDMNLCEYAAKQCPDFGCPGVTPEEVMETGLLDCGDCPIAIMYAAAIQAAELRERLKQYEDLGLNPEEMACINRGDKDCDADQLCACMGIVRRRLEKLKGGNDERKRNHQPGAWFYPGVFHGRMDGRTGPGCAGICPAAACGSERQAGKGGRRMSGMDNVERVVGGFAAAHDGLPIRVKRMNRSGPDCDVQIALDVPAGEYLGIRVFLLEELREPTPQEWTLYASKRRMGYFVAVCYDAAYAMAAIGNYLHLRPGQHFAQGVPVFKGAVF